MSELNVVIPSSGYIAVEKDNAIQEPNKTNIENPNKIHQALDEKPNKEKEPQLTPSEVTETVNEMNSLFASMNRNLSFTVDEQLGESVIIVKDSESEKVIRQIPSEELVVLRKKMDDVVGILFDTKV